MVSALTIFSTGAQAQLRVSENGRYLVQANGEPFYWLGETGWALFHKLDRDEVEFYFKTRAKQGFTVIHAAVHHVNPFVLPPKTNRYGDLPFIDDDLTKPLITPGNNPKDSTEYDFWDHAEYVIKTAEKYGLYINLLPIFGMAEGDGYNAITTENAYTYGKFIGNRFKEYSNIIWCIGGDVLVETDIQKSIWLLLATGVTEGVAGHEDFDQTLMTFHTRGGHSSSNYFSGSNWIDFHMLQTWDSYTKVYDAVSKDYNRTPIKPILHGEGAYEDGPEYPTKPITPFVIRKQVYWAMFAGGLHTYGNTNIWNFSTNPKYNNQPWMEAINSPGAHQLTISREFFEKVQWWKFVPDQSIFVGGKGSADSLNVAMRSSDGDKIIVYCSHPGPVTLNFDSIENASELSVLWTDPRNGKTQKGKKLKKGDSHQFMTPKDWKDALLLISAN